MWGLRRLRVPNRADTTLYRPSWLLLNGYRTMILVLEGMSSTSFPKSSWKSHNPSDFQRMVHSRNPIVKAMGLLCLAQLDFDKYWLTLLSHWNDNEEVYLNEGCIMSKITIGEFTQRLLSNPYFLEPQRKRPAM